HIFDTLYDMAGLISEHISVTGGITSNSSFHINDFEVIEALLDLLSRLPKQVSNNFSYGWEGFSTGELAKLNIFSSIYNYIKKSISFTTLFILDEVDLYLHPEWQRTFISELISFLKSEADTSTIQLLITTHSPLIIGDFLPEDIISLQNNNDGHTYVTEAYGFGTEITDAYISGMHISSTFGEHSREKLLKLIDRKLNGELRDEDSWLISKLKDSSIKRMLTK
ncbi:AAA family ATPase, partial [Enterobacter roggenkampii]|uniref:AAA family ATPase n=3 Tax=Enterobacter TaxID=547 RepID=UPI003D6EE17A